MQFLETEKILKNTIVIITGDHGDEFMEHGHVGHANAFTPQQIMTPLIFYRPNHLPKTYSHLTSHYDIVPTLMKTLGVNTPISDYSMGQNLFANTNNKNYAISCGWDTCSLKDDTGYMLFGIKTYNTSYTEYLDTSYKPVGANIGLDGARNQLLPIILRKMHEFLQ